VSRRILNRYGNGTVRNYRYLGPASTVLAITVIMSVFRAVADLDVHDSQTQEPSVHIELH